MTRPMNVAGIALVAGLTMGCGESESEDGLPTSPPTSTELVADAGFHDAGAIAITSDGETAYVLAHDDDNRPGLFSSSISAGTVQAVLVGPPLLYPSDLATSCDGATVFISDMGIGVEADEVGDVAVEDDTPPPLHAVDTATNTVRDLGATGLGRASAVVVSVDCTRLFVAGYSDSGEPAVFSVPVEGGEASVVYAGAPLVSPAGIHVDADDVAWVTDHGAETEQGEGVLFSIDPAGNVSAVVAGLEMGRHAGVSLVPGGETAIIPEDDEFLGSRLTAANTKTGEMSTLATPDIDQPSGVAAARDSAVMVVAGQNSIHVAKFD